MRIHYAVLLVATIIGSANAVVLAKDLTSDVSVDSVLGDLGGVSTNRFLRIHDGTEARKNDEERMFSAQSIPGVSYITQAVNNRVMNSKLAAALKREEDVDNVFSMLKLNVPGQNIFENPVFLKWAKYVDDLNGQTKNKDPKSMLPMLKSQYGDDNLAVMLEAAVKVQVKDTADVAKKLQTEQMNLWKTEGLTTDQLFKIYKLNVFEDGVTNILANPGVSVWVKYADEFNPGEKTTLFDTIRKSYSDDLVVSKILSTGELDSTTKKFATELQKQQATRWLDEKKTPDDIFDLLRLGSSKETLLANPLLHTFINYEEAFRKSIPGTDKVTLFDALKARYDDKIIVQMLNSVARKDTKTTREALYANNVQDALLTKWAKTNERGDQVLHLLGATDAKKREVLQAYAEKLILYQPKYLEA
ncbi:Avirulence (Avh) protein [Phytophthora megakarya]|uniref:RxLR effector protein n=1 Tax=Phytophthora megakarya TaxID=4795 RepID=A0A225WIA2_9STRA|nr:Avirulence (Avh) protein [Phytophthora megakarya]